MASSPLGPPAFPRLAAVAVTITITIAVLVALGVLVAVIGGRQFRR